jgi:hypothetical protein
MHSRPQRLLSIRSLVTIHQVTCEITNEKDERDCKPVARQLAPMISKFIRAKWESHEMECMEDERRQLLEEAAEFDHI